MADQERGEEDYIFKTDLQFCVYLLFCLLMLIAVYCSHRCVQSP